LVLKILAWASWILAGRVGGTCRNLVFRQERTSHREDQTEKEGSRILYQRLSLAWLSRGVGSAVLLPASLRALAALATLGPGREGGLTLVRPSHEDASAVLLPASLRALAAFAFLGPGLEGVTARMLQLLHVRTCSLPCGPSLAANCKLAACCPASTLWSPRLCAFCVPVGTGGTQQSAGIGGPWYCGPGDLPLSAGALLLLFLSVSLALGLLLRCRVGLSPFASFARRTALVSAC